MSIQSEEIEFAATELKKLADYCREIKLPSSYINDTIKRLTKYELMILDSAFKNLDLIKLRNTILFLEEPYLEMLHNTTLCLTLTIINYLNSK